MTDTTRPRLLTSPSGLTAVVQPGGALGWISWGELLLNLYPGTPLEAGPANLWVRRRTASGATAHPVLGPGGCSRVRTRTDRLVVTGERAGLRHRATLRLAEDEVAWRWTVEVTNTGDEAAEIDVVLTQDVALATPGVVRTNEFYVSQYLDHSPLAHPEHGFAVAVRQNLAQQGTHPWLLLGSTRRAVGFATDALDVHGLLARTGRAGHELTSRDLPSVRLQHEHALVALQDEAVTLDPGESHRTAFFGLLVPDHPGPTSAADLAAVDRAVAAVDALPGDATRPDAEEGVEAVPTLFEPARLLDARDLTPGEVSARYGDSLAAVESDGQGLLSFFTGVDRHVVLRRKELAVLRPHAAILRTGAHLVPDPGSLTTTTTMGGVVGSALTQGQASVNRFLSVARGYLGLQRAFGQRVFVEVDGAWRLLGTPSAFEIEPRRTRWVYAHEAGTIEVTTTAGVGEHVVSLDVRVRRGAPARFLVVHHVSGEDDGHAARRPDVEVAGDDVHIVLDPDASAARRHPGAAFRLELGGGAVGAEVLDDAVLFADGVSRHLPYVCVRTAPVRELGIRMRGLLPGTDQQPRPAEGPLVAPVLACDRSAAAERTSLLLPWLVENALVHFLSPRGIEQYTGGAWGTRDVSQGPVELLLALERHGPLRDLLLLVLRAQESDGRWPQAFGFLPDDLDFRMGPPHGDVVLWPVLALGQYLVAARDAALLDEHLPFHDAPRGATVLEHALRALAHVREEFLPGTHLMAYGHGDWNDSLQPADPLMAANLCSTWTVTLHIQALRTLAGGLRAVGRHAEAAPLAAEADAVLADLRTHLMPDGVLAGYASFGPRPGHLIHPRDTETGLRYSLLPMIHAVINDLLTPEEAERHVALIHEHLLAPDGAHLFDRPPAYRGGTMVHFQRAETATFFGREIGLMYMHAHLRWAEALHRLGRAEELLAALEVANPIGITERVPHARRRQANCYYSSSDAAFADRYQAGREYERVRTGDVAVEGGWRVYSSGAGITVRLVVECLLGVQRRADGVALDPVLPQELDTLQARLPLRGRDAVVHYAVGPRGHGPERVSLNGVELRGTRLDNRYRTGGLLLDGPELDAVLRPEGNRLEVVLP